MIDMTASGEFRDAPRQYPSVAAIVARVAAFGLLLGFAAILFWLAVFTVPILILIGIGIYAYARFQLSRQSERPVIRVWRF